MNKLLAGISLVLVLILTLARCRPTGETALTPSLVPSPSYTAAPPSTPTATPASITSSILATYNAHLQNHWNTLTAVPSRTTDPRMVIFQATQLAYWDALDASLEAKGAICRDGFKLEYRESIPRMSNEQWTLFTCSPKPEDFQTQWTPGVVDYGQRYTQVISTDLTTTWTILHTDFSWSKRPQALLSTYRWTQDGKYLYLVPLTYPGGSGWYAPRYFTNGHVLYRLNLETGEFETILRYSKSSFAFLLSPDDRLLAYSYPDEELVVHIRVMENNVERQIELEGNYVRTGAFAWKPDGSKLFFASALTGWEDGAAGISIFKLTLDNMHLQILRNNDMRLLIPFPEYANQERLYWQDDSLLYIMSLDYLSHDYYSNLALDVNTGIVVAISTPTPRP